MEPPAAAVTRAGPGSRVSGVERGAGATRLTGPLVAAALATALATVSVVCCVVSVPLAAYLSSRTSVTSILWADFVLGTVWPVAGAVVVRASPRNPVGWILVGAALIGPYRVAGYYAAAASLPGSDLPLADLATWSSVWGFVPYLVVLPLLLLLFPDGRPLTPRWRPVVLGVVAVATVTTLARMVSAVESDVAPALMNPWSLPWGWLMRVTLVGATACVLLGNLLGVVSLLLRTRRAAGRQRAQLQWLLLGGILLLVGFVAPVPGHANEVVLALGLAGPPFGVAIAMVRHRLFDVAFALNRTIVLLVLSAVVVTGYAGAVLLLGRVGATSGPGLLLVALAALVAASGRTTVQRGVDRWLFGHRGDPYAVVTRVGRHLAPAAEPLEALDLLVEALRRALRLPYVAFWDRDSGTVVASSGEPVAGWHAEPASALGRDLGELRAGLRRAGERLSAEERGAVAEVASRAATLVYAAALVDDVARSRARIVRAREEERRRLRNDLHDELGPTLAGTAHQLDALAGRLRAAGDVEGADRAETMRDRMRATVREVRDIVHGLRPPVLDQRGLAGALAGLVDGIDAPRCSTDLRLPDGIPAALEVTAYAIAAEAVANTLRHSAGSALSVAARIDDGHLVLEVDDNGQGVPARVEPGVGLRSMSERAAEVGGRLEVMASPSGGTRVRATLPYVEGDR